MSRTHLTLSQSQAIRTHRAETQFGEYDFREVEIDGLPAVEVKHRATGRTNYVFGIECTCSDHQQRCAGTLIRCKHREMVRTWDERRRRPVAEEVERQNVEAWKRAERAARDLERLWP